MRWRGIAPIYLPAPSSIAVYLWRMIADGTMAYHLGVTLLRIFAGFLLAAVTGIAARRADGHVARAWRGSPTPGSPRSIRCRRSR